MRHSHVQTYCPCCSDATYGDAKLQVRETLLPDSCSCCVYKLQSSLRGRRGGELLVCWVAGRCTTCHRSMAAFRRTCSAACAAAECWQGGVLSEPLFGGRMLHMMHDVEGYCKMRMTL